MSEQPQDLLTDIEHTQVNYSTFWQRFFAGLIDGLVLLPAVVIDSFNKSTWKSFPLLVLTFLLTLAYKPFLEAKYKATLGKMAMQLTIVDTNFEKPSLKNIILRNIFEIPTRIIIGITTFITFASAEFQNVDSAAAYTTLSNAITGATWITLALSLLSLVDAIFLIADSRRRALHDRIGQTFVIQK
jgi:uncharacterized RDD family membrane protein YckC